jgi:metal-responsive CopG/Arc/MetJ family transcriptional regulator
MPPKKTRVWAFLDDDLLGRVDEIGRSRFQKRTQVIEGMIRAECDRPHNAVVVTLVPEASGILNNMAMLEKRTVGAQAAWILEEFCKRGGQNE